MKFIVILISLILIVFGGLFSYINSSTDVIKEVKLKINYDNLEEEKQIKINDKISKVNNYLFISSLVGICMFIAGLFL